jgi:hypothetical protein
MTISTIVNTREKSTKPATSRMTNKRFHERSRRRHSACASFIAGSVYCGDEAWPTQLAVFSFPGNFAPVNAGGAPDRRSSVFRLSCFVPPLGARRLTATTAYVAEVRLVVEQVVCALLDTTGLVEEQAASGPGRSCVPVA